MGWASGSGLFGIIIDELQDVIEDKQTRKKVYKSLMEAFIQYDWDTYDECVGQDPAYDELYREWCIERGYWDEYSEENFNNLKYED